MSEVAETQGVRLATRVLAYALVVEAVRTAARQIRDEFGLADAPIEDVADFAGLRDRLKDLVVAPERAGS